MYICSLVRRKLINKKISTLCAENGSSTCKASFEEMFWMFVYKTVLDICMTLLDISIQYFWYFFGIESIICMTRLNIILRFEKCSLNVHSRLRFSIKKSNLLYSCRCI